MELIIPMGKERKSVAQVGPVGTRLILMDFFCPHLPPRWGQIGRWGRGKTKRTPLADAPCRRLAAIPSVPSL